MTDAPGWTTRRAARIGCRRARRGAGPVATLFGLALLLPTSVALLPREGAPGPATSSLGVASDAWAAAAPDDYGYRQRVAGQTSAWSWGGPACPSSDAPLLDATCRDARQFIDPPASRARDHPGDEASIRVDGKAFYRVPAAETNQYYLTARAAEFDGAAGDELVYLSQDAFLFATDGRQRDLWRWTPERWAQEFQVPRGVYFTLAFSGWPASPSAAHTDRPLDVADVNGDGRSDVFVTLSLYPQLHVRDGSEPLPDGRYVAFSAAALLDGATGRILWSVTSPGLLRHPRLADVNGDGTPDLLLSDENGPERVLVYGVWSFGNVTHPASRLLAFDGRGFAPLWQRPMGGDWTFVLDLDVADVDSDGAPEALIARMPEGVGGDNTARKGWTIDAFEARTGRPRWSAPVDVPVHEVDAAGDVVFYRSDSLLVALEGRGGSERGRHGFADALLWDLQTSEPGATGKARAIVAGTHWEYWIEGSPYADRSFLASFDTDAAEAWRYDVWTQVERPAEDLPASRVGPAPLLLRSQIFREADGRMRVAAPEYRGDGVDLLLFDAEAQGTHLPVARLPGAYDFLSLAAAPSGGLLAATFGGHFDHVLDGVAEARGTPLAHLLYGQVHLDVTADDVPDALVAGQSGVVYAIDPTRLGGDRLRWATPCGEPHEATPIFELRLVPRGADGDFLAAASLHALCRIDPHTGNLLWSYAPPAERVYERYFGLQAEDLNGDGTPDLLAAGTRILALDGRTGQELWSFGLPRDHLYDLVPGVPRPVHERSVYDNAYSTLAVGDLDGDGVADAVAQVVLTYARHHALLVAVSGATGAPVWIVPLAQPTLVPALWDSTLVADLDGDGAPEVVTGYLTLTDAVTAGEALPVAVTGSGATTLAAYDGATGRPLWLHKLSGNVLANGLRVVPTGDGRHAVLALSIFGGWALVAPDGRLAWFQESDTGQPRRGVQPWDARAVDLDADGDLDVVVADWKVWVQAFEGSAFARGELEPLFTTFGASAVRFLPAADTAPTGVVGYAAFPFSAWIAKHREAGISIQGKSTAAWGTGLLSLVPPPTAAEAQESPVAPSSGALLLPTLIAGALALAVGGPALAYLRARGNRP